MMQWDKEDPLLQPKLAKTEAHDARLRTDTRRPTPSTTGDLKIKTSASKPQQAAPVHKPTLKAKQPTPARRGLGARWDSTCASCASSSAWRVVLATSYGIQCSSIFMSSS